ncbi:hypothetical protein ACIXGO_04815 [Bacteroides fragilis]
MNNTRRQGLNFLIGALIELTDILIVRDYYKIKTIEKTDENIENGKFEIRCRISRYVRDLVVFTDKLIKLFGIRINKGQVFSIDYLYNIIEELKLQLKNEIETHKTDNILPKFAGDEKNLEGHFKFSRDNERYLFDYLNELYNIFNIGDKKLCKQNRLGGICAIIYDSKIITNCNTFSECMRLLCGYWKRETPKDCRLNKYQDAKQELLDKHRILNEIPRK